MISEKTTSLKTKKAISPGLAIFRTVKGFLQPILVFVTVFCLLLSLFEPMEGTHSREKMWIVAAVAIVLITIMSVLQKYLEETNASYKMYIPKLERNIQPSAFLIMLLVTVVVLVPFYIIVVTSLKKSTEAINIDFSWKIKEGVTTEGYALLQEYSKAFDISLLRAYCVSLMMATFPTLLSLLVSAASAFMFAQGRFRGKKGLFRGLIYTMLMPGCVTLSSSVLMWDALRMIGTPIPLVAGCFFGAAGTVMFLREYMSSLAKELFESADIDGAGRVRQYFSIVLPIAKPALTGQFILGFIGGFNDYMGPLIYMNNPFWFTVQIVLDFFNTGNLEYNVLAAGCVIVTVPMVVLYLIFQKQILAGVQMSHGIKG